MFTRCGGPEEYVTPHDGIMVPEDDPPALADGIVRALERRETFDAEDLRSRFVNRFGRAAWCQRAMAIYERLATRNVNRADAGR